ncbi:hypothetical protein TNCV_1246071 [Trichonephila clavipes]|uniref:Uncharacterized protein n=1 Tax=Trichonephila clavipes TaxID=2585209 RepID=A0A8X6REQ1_TRICX|nr:hypothetical protein TNCV_1246071 [Trichonephila clavipes]
MTPDLAPTLTAFCPNGRTGGYSRFTVKQPFYTGSFQWYKDTNPRLEKGGHEFVTITTRLLRRQDFDNSSEVAMFIWRTVFVEFGFLYISLESYGFSTKN